MQQPACHSCPATAAAPPSSSPLPLRIPPCKLLPRICLLAASWHCSSHRPVSSLFPQTWLLTAWRSPADGQVPAAVYRRDGAAVQGAQGGGGARPRHADHLLGTEGAGACRRGERHKPLPVAAGSSSSTPGCSQAVTEPKQWQRSEAAAASLCTAMYHQRQSSLINLLNFLASLITCFCTDISFYTRECPYCSILHHHGSRTKADGEQKCALQGGS